MKPIKHEMHTIHTHECICKVVDTCMHAKAIHCGCMCVCVYVMYVCVFMHACMQKLYVCMHVCKNCVCFCVCMHACTFHAYIFYTKDHESI